MAFTPESLAQLDAVGTNLVKIIDAIIEKKPFDAISELLQEVALTQTITDEVKADKAKAIARVLGAASSAYGAS